MPRAYSYHVTTPPANLPVTLVQVREHLHLDASDPSNDFLTALIKAATLVGEKITKRTFINTTFRTYRDFFESCIKIRKSELQSLESFQYEVAGVFGDVDSDLYYLTEEEDFPKIVLRYDESWPDDIDIKLQSIRIDFIAGYGADSTAVPEDIQQALLNHIAILYENRGDCDQGLADPDYWAKSLPATSQLLYELNRIMDIHDGCI